MSTGDEPRGLVVRPRTSLAERAVTAVLLGTGPDGLPLILRVERQTAVERAVLAALGRASREGLAPAIAEALLHLEAAVGGITSLAGQRAYRTTQVVGTLLGQTLLVRLLGGGSPLLLSEPHLADPSPPGHLAPDATVSTAPPAAAFVPQTAATPTATAPQVLQVTGNQRRLAVPLDDAVPFIVSEQPSSSAEPTLRPCLFEDLHALPETRVQLARANGNLDEVVLAEVDADAYARLVREAETVTWTVSRRDLGQAVVQLARALATDHTAGRVHGDVKTANIVLTAAGAVPIDAVGTPVGDVSPAVTPGWAAPEQVLAQPVSPATDVYALGLLAVSLVGGAIYGEERTHIIATGGRARQRVQVLANGGVFIDEQTLPLAAETRGAWQALLTHCLAFAPEDRPADGAAFADAVEHLLQTDGLPGLLPVGGGPGELVRTVDLAGEPRPAWVVTDRW